MCYLVELGLRVDVDLTHFAMEALVAHAQAALVGQSLAFTRSTGGQRLPPSPWQHALSLQHQFVLDTCEELGSGVMNVARNTKTTTMS